MFTQSIRGLIFICATLLLTLSLQGPVEAAIDCFSCHDRAAFQKRVNHEPAAEGDCFACHNPHVARFEGLLQEKTRDLCYSCHEDEASEHLQGFVHAPVTRGECLGCHDPHASNHDNLLNARSSETCFSCHDSLQREYKNSHAPYAKGQCDACHQSHQSDFAYLLKKDAEDLCFNCHSGSSLQNKHAGFPAELGKCGSCHNPHGSDRPGLVRNALHAPYADGCADCHAGKGVPVRIDSCLGCHPDVSEQMSSSHNHLVRYEDNGCIACHSPHAADDERLLKGSERHVCGTCHEATFKRHEESAYKHEMTDACNDCHAPHGSNHPAMLAAPINQVCNNCHGLHGSFTHPIGVDVFDPRTGQMMTCASCHATKGTDFAYHARQERKKALCIECHETY